MNETLIHDRASVHRHKQKRMKILLISGIPVFPTHEGNRSRILALTRAIRALGHDLWFVLLPSGISSPHDREAHIAEFGEGHFLELPPQGKVAQLTSFIRWFPFRLRRKICRILNLPTGFYSGLDQLYQPAWSPPLADLHRRYQFDAVIVEYVFHSTALLSFPNELRKIIDTHDAFADRHKPYVERGIKHDYWVSFRPEVENKGFRRADAILAIQNEEAERFRAQLGQDHANPDIAVVSHFLDLDHGPVLDHSPCRALFLASANPSNLASARSFITNVLPLVLERIPQFQLVLAGSICGAIDDHPAIRKLGIVERVIDAFQQAPLLVNPMVVGTGINIKVLDALAAGVPIISTDVGVRGVPEDIRQCLTTVPVGDHHAFADQLAMLISDEPLRKSLGAKARTAAIQWNLQQQQALQRALTMDLDSLGNFDEQRDRGFKLSLLHNG